MSKMTEETGEMDSIQCTQKIRQTTYRERETDLVHKGTTKNEYETTSTVMYHDEIAYIFEVKKNGKSSLEM